MGVRWKFGKELDSKNTINDLDRINAAIQSLNTQIQNNKNEIGNLTVAKGELESKINTLIQVNQQLLNSITDINNSIQQIQGDIRALTVANTKQDNLISGLVQFKAKLDKSLYISNSFVRFQVPSYSSYLELQEGGNVILSGNDGKTQYWIYNGGLKGRIPPDSILKDIQLKP